MKCKNSPFIHGLGCHLVVYVCICSNYDTGQHRFLAFMIFFMCLRVNLRPFQPKIPGMNFVKLRIHKIQLETADTVSVFWCPHDLAEQFRFVPGQYLTLRANVSGSEVRRAYSISSAPTIHIGVTIKRLAGGRLSTFIHSNWKAGDLVEVAAPGQFYPSHRSR